MLPSVNSLLEFPGILRDSLGNFVGPSGGKDNRRPPRAAKRTGDAPKFRIAGLRR
jgi:hypothetical protein